MPRALDFSVPDRIFQLSRRPVRSGGYRCGLLSAGALALTMLVSGQAAADWGGAWIGELDAAVITVASDGETYTSVEGSSPAIKGRIGMSLDAHEFGRVKAWSLWWSMQAYGAQKKQFPELKYSKTYPLGDRPKKVKRDLPFSIPRQSYKSYAVEACNQLASLLRNDLGRTDEQIFGMDRVLSVKVRAEVSWDMSGYADDFGPAREQVGAGAVDKPEVKDVTINCMKTPVAPVVPEVTGVAMIVNGYDPINRGGQCQMRLKGSISSNIPNVDVTFRYVDGSGKESDLKTINTTADQSGSFEHSYPFSPGHKTGKVRIVGENYNFASDWKDYDFECGEKPTQDFATLLPPEIKLLEVGEMAPKFENQGHICPLKAKMIGGYLGRGPSSGRAVLTANGQVQKMQAFSIEDGEMKYIDGEFNLPWSRVGGPFTQSVRFVFTLFNAEGAEVDRITKGGRYSCKQIVNATVMQLDSGFNIRAPRRFARNGQIHLEGAAPDQAFELTFLRKTKRGYKAYKSPHLPKEMTGGKAQFNVRALEAGDWRLKVCEVQEKKRTAAVKNCEQSNFKLMKRKAPGQKKTSSRGGRN